MEINKMLTISTAHVSEQTAELLDNDGIYGVIVYPKDQYGWFIVIEEDCMKDYKDDIPNELLRLMKFTKANNCDWLCLDCDGEIIEYLETFDW